MSPKPKGTCPVCGEDRSLRKDGTLARHLDLNRMPTNPYAAAWCDGSGVAPIRWTLP